jgi:hypothetical protein
MLPFTFADSNRICRSATLDMLTRHAVTEVLTRSGWFVSSTARTSLGTRIRPPCVESTQPLVRPTDEISPREIAIDHSQYLAHHEHRDSGDRTWAERTEYSRDVSPGKTCKSRLCVDSTHDLQARGHAPISPLRDQRLPASAP